MEPKAPPKAPPDSAEILHATTVAHSNRALLILGASGTGKSALALQMIAAGAKLVADDRTSVWRKGTAIWAACPPTLAGLIEARGLGIVHAPTAPACQIAAVLDLNQAETSERLQNTQNIDLLGVNLPLYRPSSAAHFPAALTLLLSHGRHG